MEDRSEPLDTIHAAVGPAAAPPPLLHNWRRRPPLLRGLGVLIRELAPPDAVPLLDLLSAEEVSRFMAPPPADAHAMERFICSAQEERAAGESLCLAVVPDTLTHPVGVFRVRQVERDFGVAEWSFALASRYWGEGLFYAAAPLMIDFVFDELGARRLEARTAVANGRGSGALRKLGAVQEALLRQSLDRNGTPVDQVLWAILAGDWRARCPARKLKVH